ncbi:EAL domain-containing protein [Listeria aquatica]|uniref:EAL domain-containing protein n=1 Tax=Listeria aquatica FSL S10-1188 TaxID=1265818 RepID=W7B9M8_9LIST|nr:hypothetical protein MAQA_05423 [Listeria aquatica FSL S10-1188]
MAIFLYGLLILKSTSQYAIYRALSQPVKLVKIDAALLRDIEHKKEKLQVLAHLFLFLERNNRELIVTGVERPEQLHFLKNPDVRYAQGYYFISSRNEQENGG